MAAKTFRCTNYGDCDLALNKELVEIEEGEEVLCPGCSKKSLVPSDQKSARGGGGLGKKLAIAAVVVIVVAGAAAWMIWPRENPNLANAMLSEFFPRLPR